MEASMKYCATLLVVALVVVVVAPQAQQQPPSNNISVYRITGTVFCSLNGAQVVNSAIPTPPFTNATVQLMCGGIVVQTALTNSLGVFTMVVPDAQTLVQTLLSNLVSVVNCSVVVATPLSTCNSSLPQTGMLQSPTFMQVLTEVFQAILNFLFNDLVGEFQHVQTILIS
uniref:phylloplanin-like n=1 Tax=Erigeron canadensis TaxID=72917 RepID=UPI001CB8F7F9|nr:phylloplanin-like [Erigeron canadensis]